MLHYGAALHGHEFSDNSLRKLTLPRSSFSTPSRASTSNDNSPLPTSIRPARRTSTTGKKVRERVSFLEPDSDTMSCDGKSYANSEGSETTSAGDTSKKRKRRSIRTSVSYCLAHPAPNLSQKQKLLIIRPKLLFQFQRISLHARPKPIIDVMPSSVVVPRLLKKFPRMFKGKSELGANDVMVVRSEDYDAPDRDKELESGDDESVAAREVLAVICQIRGLPGSTEICFSDGSKWYATPLPKGVYEFVTTDEFSGERTTARWVPRGRVRKDPEASSNGTSMANISDTRYQFSILNPDSRRHPILASVTSNTLDIPDHYTTISSSASRYPPTSPIRTSTGGNVLEEDVTVERSTKPIDDDLRTLIQVTAVWVALRQGWCQYFRYNDTCPELTESKSSPIVPQTHSRPRSISYTPSDSGKKNTNDILFNTPESNHYPVASVSGKGLRTNNPFRGSPASTNTSQFELAPPPPKRSISTGTAFMQRTAARRAGNMPSTVLSDSDGESKPSPPHRAFTTPETPTGYRRGPIMMNPQEPSDPSYDYKDSQPDIQIQHPETQKSHAHLPKRGHAFKGKRWRSFCNLFRRSDSTMSA